MIWHLSPTGSFFYCVWLLYEDCTFSPFIFEYHTLFTILALLINWQYKMLLKIKFRNTQIHVSNIYRWLHRHTLEKVKVFKLSWIRNLIHGKEDLPLKVQWETHLNGDIVYSDVNTRINIVMSLTTIA